MWAKNISPEHCNQRYNSWKLPFQQNLEFLGRKIGRKNPRNIAPTIATWKIVPENEPKKTALKSQEVTSEIDRRFRGKRFRPVRWCWRN
jgi:hypothetical protein